MFKPRVHASDSAQYHFGLDFGSKQVDVVCSAVRREEFLLAEGEESAEGIGLDDGTIKYVDLSKRDNGLVSHIKNESRLNRGQQRVRELWLVILNQFEMVRLGDYLHRGILESSPAIINARRYVQSHGAGPFDRIYYFSLPSRTADYVGPLYAESLQSKIEWRVFENFERGFRIELPGEPVKSDSEFEIAAVVKTDYFEVAIEDNLISFSCTEHSERQDPASAIEHFCNAIVEIYQLPLLDSRSFPLNGHQASHLQLGQLGHYVSARMMAAPERSLVALIDSRRPVHDSPMSLRVFQSMALLDPETGT